MQINIFMGTRWMPSSPQGAKELVYARLSEGHPQPQTPLVAPTPPHIDRATGFLNAVFQPVEEKRHE
jgi:hypothetical protein